MKRLIFLLAIVVGFASCQPALPPKAPLLKVEDFFRNPEKTAFKLSPSGEYFSYMAPYNTSLKM